VNNNGNANWNNASNSNGISPDIGAVRLLLKRNKRLPKGEYTPCRKAKYSRDTTEGERFLHGAGRM
jgi:hypothetical protein